jgi:uncharacterized protein (DUF362 family)/ferredoxin
MASTDRVLVLDASYDDLAAAVGRVFDELGPSLDGRSVLVKPNMILAWPPEWGATTHPSLVRACVQEITARGGKPLVGDTPGASYLTRTRSVAAKTGILEAAGGSYVDIDQKVEDRRLDAVDETVPFSRAALDADLVVSLPKMKTHSLTTLTGAVKNSYGLVVGAAKSRLHRLAADPASFARIVVDVYRQRPADLVIMDAVVAMQGNGPTTRDLCRPGKLIASTNAVAVDSVAARLMGLAPDQVPTNAVAAEQGLGPLDCEVDGDASPLAGFRLPLTSRLGWLTDLGSAVAATTFFASISKPRLELRRERCVSCGACARGCPTGAIAMEREATKKRAHGGRPLLPVVDRSLCIACFCCTEQCPEEAWVLSARTRALGAAGRLFSEEAAAAGDRVVSALRRLRGGGTG